MTVGNNLEKYKGNQNRKHLDLLIDMEIKDLQRDI